jgi:HSP20 family protein
MVCKSLLEVLPMFKNADLNKWQSLANQVLGSDFFSEFTSQTTTTSINSATLPRHNMYRNSNEIVILVELPYVFDLSQIKMNVEERELSIKGHIELGMQHMEVVEAKIFSGPFEKKISLPVDVNPKKVNAKYKRGILFIQLFPKVKAQGETIKIRE